MNQSCDKFQTDASVKASAKTNLPKIRLNMNSTQQISIIQGSQDTLKHSSPIFEKFNLPRKADSPTITSPREIKTPVSESFHPIFTISEEPGERLYEKNG